MQFLYHPMEYFPQGWWGSGFQHNGPRLDGPVIYATWLPGELPRLHACYPDRRLFLYYGTLEKGMLFPVSPEDQAVDYTRPQPARASGHGRFALIDDPLEFFTLYSPEFREFVSQVFEIEDYSGIDVKHLLEQGTLLFNQGLFQKAAYYYEAALQIEKSPKEREIYLNMLSKCYFKLGLYQETKAIAERLRALDNKKYYNILPERGI
jgi:tetratricopeptide (TPR) repeat protein